MQTQSITQNPDRSTLYLLGIIYSSYTITATDYSNAYGSVTIAHNITGIKPNIVGSVINSSDGSERPLPAFWAGNSSFYGGPNTFDASCFIDRIDSTNVYIRFYIYSIVGLSIFLTNNTLNFKLYCLRESIV